MPDLEVVEALERFRESEEDTADNRRHAEEDIAFARLGDQWPDEIRKLREEENRPCLTINRLPTFIRQVVNDARQNKPGITVHPVDGGADEDTARVLAGLIRSIERNSRADIAYDMAIDHAVTSGFGFFRLGIDFVHPDSFAKEIKIHSVPDPMLVHWDIKSKASDSSDWDYAFVSDFLTQDDFEAMYPDAAPVSFETGNEHATLWKMGDKVRIAEYWLRERKERTILLLSDGSVVREDELDEDIELMMFLNGVEVIDQRRSEFHEVKRRIISGVEVLEEEDWPGSMIPICPVWGDDVWHEGVRHFRSLVRDARDPQAMFNFWRTASTELVALAPKAPWVGPKGFTKGNEEQWATANSRTYAYLEYDDNSGSGPPQRQPFAGVPAGVVQEALSASDDMKAVMGIFDAALGASGNEKSGKAIMARQREADVSNFHFVDNLNRAIGHAGRMILEIIPHVYTVQEVVRILGEDMRDEVVQLANGSRVVRVDESGEEVPIYDFSVGQYDVVVRSGPSFTTQREETREFLLELMRVVPAAAPLIGDVLIDNMDFAQADKIAKRIQAVLPPQIQAMEGIAPAVTPGVQPQDEAALLAASGLIQ